MNTRKPKNPLVAALLALFIGPLGFFYFSWKAVLVGSAIAILLAEGARSWSGTGSLPSWWPFVGTPFCALYAYLSVRRLSARSQQRSHVSRSIGLLLYGITVYSVILGIVALVRGGEWGVRFLIAALTFTVGFILWWKKPEQTLDLPTETVAELQKRLGPEFAFLRSLVREGLISTEFSEEEKRDFHYLSSRLVLNLNLLAPTFLQAGRLAEAEETCRLVQRLVPGDLVSKTWLASILGKTGRLTDAHQYAQECLGRLGPESEDLRHMLEEIVTNAPEAEKPAMHGPPGKVVRTGEDASTTDGDVLAVKARVRDLLREGRSERDIALEMGVTVATVDKLVHEIQAEDQRTV